VFDGGQDIQSEGFISAMLKSGTKRSYDPSLGRMYFGHFLDICREISLLCLLSFGGVGRVLGIGS
jgi:hypothetical protein